MAFGEDPVGDLGPAEWFAALVVGVDERADRGGQVGTLVKVPRRMEALAAVAWAIAAGDPGQAETTARSITDPSAQARAFAKVGGVIAASDPDRAGRLLGAVLAEASWRAPLSVLAKHWPRAVLQCAGELSGNERSRDTD